MSTPRHGLPAAITLITLITVTMFTMSMMLLTAACGGGSDAPRPPGSPTPSPAPSPTVTANAYILPDAIAKNDWAFGDEPVVIHRGERLRWVNADTVAHQIVADSPDATDFRKTDELLQPGGEQSFVMNKLGTTGIHCSVHPNMTGTLIVRER